MKMTTSRNTDQGPSSTLKDASPHPRNFRRQLEVAIVGYALAGLFLSRAIAADYQWLPSSSDFNIGSNWVDFVNGSTPTATDRAAFTLPSYDYQPQLTANASVRGIYLQFNSGAVTFTASNPTTLSLGDLGLNNTSGSQLSFNDSNLSLAVVSNATFTANGPITVGSSTAELNIGTSTLTLGGSSIGSSLAKGIASSAGNVVKSGTGSWEMSAANSYTGSTTVNAGVLAFSAAANLSSSLTVNSGGTLRLAATDSFGSSAAVTLNGGTIQFSGGAFSQNFSGTPLNLTASSAIDFGSGLGASTLSFGSSSGQSWNGALSISNYSAGSDVLRFGTDANALSPTQLAAINFSGFASGAQIDSSGYVTPVPEPSTYAFILGSIAFALNAYRHRKQNGSSGC